MQISKIHNFTIQRLRRLPRAGIIYAIRSEDILAIKSHQSSNAVIKKLNSNNNKAISYHQSESSRNSSDSEETIITSSLPSENKCDSNNDQHQPLSTSDNFMEHLFIESNNKIKPRNKNINQNSLIVQRGSFGINASSDVITENSDTKDDITKPNQIERSKIITKNPKTTRRHDKKGNGIIKIPVKPNKKRKEKLKTKDNSIFTNFRDNIHTNDPKANLENSAFKTDSESTPTMSDPGKSKTNNLSETHLKQPQKSEPRVLPTNINSKKSKESIKSEFHSKLMPKADSFISQKDVNLRYKKQLLEVKEKECDGDSDSSGHIYQERADDDMLTKYQDVCTELSRLKVKYNELILENCKIKQISENLTMETENLKYENSNVKTRNETLAAKNLENQNFSRIVDSLNRKIKELCMQVDDFQTKDSVKTRRLFELESNLIEFQEKASSCKIDMEHLKNQLMQRDLELKRLTQNQKFDEEKDLQIKLIHNELIELRGNIRVLCRIKPEPNNLIQILNNETLQLPPQKYKSVCPVYNFNRVFKTNSSQSEVFSEVRQLITSFVDGYNVNMITYGQSGSGKTFTMIGTKDQPGIVTHSIREVFKLCNQRTTWCFKICLSVLEIYNETIFDLLTTSRNPKSIWKKRTQIHDDGKCIHIKGLSEIEIKHEDELLNYVLKSGRNRSSCMTTLNNDSSRSHFIVMLRISGKNTFQNCTSQGVLMLCDLAGSENCTSSLSECSMTESKYISKSLTVLGRVFEALYNKLLVIPFRDSKLTHILKPSLTGDAKFAFIVTLSGKAENLNNTIRVLNLARKVAQISLGQPRKNTINAVGKAIGRAELLCQSG